MYDVLVVGAGPSGSKTAEMCSKLGINTLLVEKNRKVGTPVQCTGLFSHRIFEVSGASRKACLNVVKRARFYSPDRNFVELESKKPAYVFDREAFDKELFSKAKDAGTETRLGVEFLGMKRMKDYLEVETSAGTFETRILVGADGPNSSVAKASKIKLPKDIIVGYQETLKGDFTSDQVELWFGKDISPDFFGWVVPVNKNSARIGIGARKNVSGFFRHFISQRFDGEPKRIRSGGGVIRRGMIKTSVADRVLLVGDAACQIKPYSGGGVVYGLIGSRLASNACFLSLVRADFKAKFFKEYYDTVWKRQLSRGIFKGFVIDRVIHGMPDFGLNLGTKLSNRFKFLLQNMDMDLI
jgi:digeranylgeranylglycerophospholipid reductase